MYPRSACWFRVPNGRVPPNWRARASATGKMPPLAGPLAEATRTILCVARSSSLAVACSVPFAAQKSPYTISFAPATSAAALSVEIPGPPEPPAERRVHGTQGAPLDGVALRGTLQFAGHNLGKTAAHPIQRGVGGEVLKARDGHLGENLLAIAARTGSETCQQDNDQSSKVHYDVGRDSSPAAGVHAGLCVLGERAFLGPGYRTRGSSLSSSLNAGKSRKAANSGSCNSFLRSVKPSSSAFRIYCSARSVWPCLA